MNRPAILLVPFLAVFGCVTLREKNAHMVPVNPEEERCPNVDKALLVFERVRSNIG